MWAPFDRFTGKITMMSNVLQQDQTEPGTLRIGTAPVNWNNNDLPNWRPFVPLPNILDEMRSAGYTETEWDESFGTDVKVLNWERSTRGMMFTGAYRWLDFVDDEAFERDLELVKPFMETLQGIGARHLIVADYLRPHRVAIAGSVPVDGSASLDDSAYRRFVINLDRLADTASAFDLSVHYHNHVGSYIETPDEVASLMRYLIDSRVDLCFDTGHYVFGGGDAHDFIATHHSSVGYLHLKDVDGDVLAEARAQGWNFLDALRHYIFSPIGTGNARIRDIIDLLATVAFEGHVIIEQDTCQDDSTLNARANLDVVRRFEAAVDSTRRTPS